MKEVLTFDITCTRTIEVKGTRAEAVMIVFNGSADCENFKGIVLPGGIDTQKEWYGTPRSLSARYILEGIDCAGQKCRIFVENNGEAGANGIESTKPRIITDSKALSYLETSELLGTLEPSEHGVIIHIFLKD